MPPFVRVLFVECCMLTMTAWMHDIANSSVDRTVSPSAIIFPSSFIAPFSATNQGANSDSPEMQYIHAVEAVFAVTTRLKASLGLDATKNLLVSPISTTTALAQLLLGARGPSRNRLLNILTATRRFRNIQEPTAAEFHVQLGGLIRFLQTNPNDDDAYQLHFASALFLQPGLTLLPNFQAAVTDLYGMDILPADFSGDPLSSLNKINQWAASHTMGVINQVFSHPLPRTTTAVLTNAIYFKGDWEIPFNPRYTISGKFRSSATHTVDVEYMRGQFSLMYVDSKKLGCRMISIPYKRSKAAMYVVLPDVGDLYNIQGFAAGLSVDDFEELISSATLASVTLVMPKMKLTQTFSIGKTLSRIQEQIEFHSDYNHEKVQKCESHRCDGWNCPQYCQSFYNVSSDNGNYEEVPGIAGYKFDMSGASSDDRFQVDDIIHHVYLEVSEAGTVGAAVTSTIMDYFGEFRDFKMDRPFIFFILHELAGSPIFWGTVVDPTG